MSGTERADTSLFAIVVANSASDFARASQCSLICSRAQNWDWFDQCVQRCVDDSNHVLPISRSSCGPELGLFKTAKAAAELAGQSLRVAAGAPDQPLAPPRRERILCKKVGPIHPIKCSRHRCDRKKCRQRRLSEQRQAIRRGGKTTPCQKAQFRRSFVERGRGAASEYIRGFDPVAIKKLDRQIEPAACRMARNGCQNFGQGMGYSRR